MSGEGLATTAAAFGNSGRLDKVVATVPGYVAEVRRLVLYPLTRTQVRQLHDIATRIRQAARPDGCPPILPTP